MADKPTPKRRRRTALTAQARERRDRYIVDMFLAGHTQQRIAEDEQVNLTAARVSQIIAIELERATTDHIVRSEKAMTIYVARMEILVREAFAHVTGGELKAIEVARRLMEQQAKIYGLVDDDRTATVAIPPMSDAELDEEPTDDLARYRAQRDSTQADKTDKTEGSA